MRLPAVLADENETAIELRAVPSMAFDCTRAMLFATPAATVMLIRDTAEGIKTFLMRRHMQMEFVAGVMVFPGGGVEFEGAEAKRRIAGRGGSQGLVPPAY